MPIIFNTLEELNFALINELGLSIGPDYVLNDQDTFNPITSEGKTIKCSIDPNHPVYQSDNSLVLNPIDIQNTRLMTTMMGFYFEKEKINNGIYVNTFYFTDSKVDAPKKGKNEIVSSNITVTYQDHTGTVYNMTSRSYMNRVLKFADIILRMGGMDVDLSNFDQVI